MTVEERVQKFFKDDDVEWIGTKRVKRFQERVAQLLRDQIEECAQAIDKRKAQQQAGGNITFEYIIKYCADDIRALAEPKEEVKTNDR